MSKSRPGRRRWPFAVAAVLLLLGGGALVAPRILFSDGVDYSGVTSIERTPEWKDPALLDRAWALPVARRYREAGIDYQKNGSFCGPTSVVNVLKSLGLAADQTTILAGTETRTFLGLLPGGVTLDKLADIARQKTGRRVTVLRDLDLAQLRAHLVKSNDPARRYIANFHRGPLFGRGGGHHSPIAGYLADADLALILDVNDDYRPWLVKAERLHDAVHTRDKSSGQSRGLLLIE
ncbi:MAG TPA: phytochelatin synthase family protein [Kofleriaceae bacterium]|nr:phytochelatin synthase family protein [Kofleriaceae bacterium]